MVGVVDKKIAVLGKLGGKYASRGRELQGRLGQLGAVLVDGLSADPDIVVMAAKSKGFIKRVTKAGLPTMTEAELEAAVEHAFDQASEPTPTTPKVGRSEFVGLVAACTAGTPSPVALRQRLLVALVEAQAGGYDVALGPALRLDEFGDLPKDPEQVVARELLVWASHAGCQLFALPPELDAATLEDARRLAGTAVYFGDDCPLPTLVAAARTLARMGDAPSRLWGLLAGELENRDADPAAVGIASVNDLRCPTTLVGSKLEAAKSFDFAVSRLIVVDEQIDG